MFILKNCSTQQIQRNIKNIKEVVV